MVKMKVYIRKTDLKHRALELRIDLNICPGHFLSKETIKTRSHMVKMKVYIRLYIKFFALRVTPPAHPVQALAQKGPNIAPTWDQKTGKMGYPIGPGRPKMGYPIGPWGPHFRKNRLKKATQQKRRMDPTALPPRSRKSRQHSPNLGPKLELKWTKNRCKNASFF